VVGSTEGWLLSTAGESPSLLQADSDKAMSAKSKDFVFIMRFLNFYKFNVVYSINILSLCLIY